MRSIRVIYLYKIPTLLLYVCTGKGDVTIKVKDNDFMDMASGKLSPQKVCSNIDSKALSF